MAAIAALAPARGRADPDGDAQRALGRVDQRAAARDPAAIDAYEALGAATPATQWSEVAWARAAQLAEQASDFARARRDLERVIAIGRDVRRVERARADLARLASFTGGGRWDQVAAEHDRLAAQLQAGGDPKPALGKLEALVTANPGYPRAISAVLEVADGWERDGNTEHAIAWLTARRRDAEDADRQIAIALIGVRARHADLEGAEAELASYEAWPQANRVVAGELRDAVDEARDRQWWRRAAWLAVLAVAVLAALSLVRERAGRRRTLRGLIRPPTEVVFLLPVGVVLAVVAATGNPMVARAVRQIVIAGLAVAWLSGGLLDARRKAHGSVGAARAIAHAVAAVLTVAAVGYLALDHDGMLDLVAETWRTGPAMR